MTRDIRLTEKYQAMPSMPPEPGVIMIKGDRL